MNANSGAKNLCTCRVALFTEALLDNTSDHGNWRMNIFSNAKIKKLSQVNNEPGKT